MKLLLELLPRYCEHVEKHPHTLLIKFYGLHRVRPLKGAKVKLLASSCTAAADARSAAVLAQRIGLSCSQPAQQTLPSAGLFCSLQNSDCPCTLPAHWLAWQPAV